MLLCEEVQANVLEENNLGLSHLCPKKILINFDKNVHECKGYNAPQFITEFPDEGWTKNNINRLVVKLRKFSRTV